MMTDKQIDSLIRSAGLGKDAKKAGVREKLHDLCRSAIAEHETSTHFTVADAHEWIRPSLALADDAPLRFDYYAQRIEDLRAELASTQAQLAALVSAKSLRGQPLEDLEPRATAREASEAVMFVAKNRNKPLTAFRLQALLYRADTLCLQQENRPLIDEDFQAWVLGATLVSVREEHLRDHLINEHFPMSLPKDLPAPCPHLLAYVERAFDSLAHVPDTEPENLGRQDGAWARVRSGVGTTEPSTATIPKTMMRDEGGAAARHQARTEKMSYVEFEYNH